MLRKIILAFGVAFVLFAGLQLFRPSFENLAYDERLSPEKLEIPPAVHAILRRSCFDCHSSATQLRWFDQVMPIYALVVKDVKAGRQNLNFSDWSTLSAAEKKGSWFTAINQILNEGMPLKNYLAVHPEATISAADRDVLKSFVGQMLIRVVSGQAAEAQPSGASIKREVLPAPNGIPFFKAYGSWAVVNTSDRVDNGTTRAILGNDLAVKAIQDNHTNPWPDGVAFAKVAWKAAASPSDGLIRDGAFFQVEFMSKDAKKYSSSLGWGFARWRGEELKPYGKDASFTQECITCHAPLKSRDFVYTDPTEFRADRLGFRLIATFIDPVKQTMSTLYGKGPGQKSLGQEETRLLDTYQTQDDARWFGARVPEKWLTSESRETGSANPLLQAPHAELPN